MFETILLSIVSLNLMLTTLVLTILFKHHWSIAELKQKVNFLYEYFNDKKE